MRQQRPRKLQEQMTLPMLQTMESLGGTATCKDLYAGVAKRMDLDESAVTSTVRVGKQDVNVFQRSVRWAQQKARLAGLVSRGGEKDWELTGEGKKTLRSSRPGLVVTLWTTDQGVALWGSCTDAIGLLDDASINLVLTSPPYPLATPKSYGNEAEGKYVSWLLRIVESWTRCVTDDGSVVLNLGDAWLRGHPNLSLYREKLLIRLQEELGYNLCQTFFWNNPSKLPAPAEWVCVRRVRVKPSVETVFWLSRSSMPKADNRNVLVPYGKSMLGVLETGGQRKASKPSGYEMAEGAFRTDNQGAIPGTMILAANTTSNDPYMSACREHGLQIHPARFPAALPEMLIRLLTDKNDLVFDPFAGSGVTAKVAEMLGRRWITCEKIRDYVEGARLRFANAVENGG